MRNCCGHKITCSSYRHFFLPHASSCPYAGHWLALHRITGGRRIVSHPGEDVGNVREVLVRGGRLAWVTEWVSYCSTRDDAIFERFAGADFFRASVEVGFRDRRATNPAY